jgi:hypothetical protein
LTDIVPHTTPVHQLVLDLMPDTCRWLRLGRFKEVVDQVRDRCQGILQADISPAHD